jgi:hypothetical protein
LGCVCPGLASNCECPDLCLLTRQN